MRRRFSPRQPGAWPLGAQGIPLYRDLAGDLGRCLGLDPSCSSNSSVQLSSAGEPGGRVFDPHLRDHPEHALGNSGQLRWRKVGCPGGDAQVADMVFPVHGKSRLKQLDEFSHAGQGRGCRRAHGFTAPGSVMQSRWLSMAVADAA